MNAIKKIIVEDLDLKEWLEKEIDMDLCEIDNSWIDGGYEESRVGLIEDMLKDEYFRETEKVTALQYVDTKFDLLYSSALNALAKEIYSELYDEAWENVMNEHDSPAQEAKDYYELQKAIAGR